MEQHESTLVQTTWLRQLRRFFVSWHGAVVLAIFIILLPIFLYFFLNSSFFDTASAGQSASVVQAVGESTRVEANALPPVLVTTEESDEQSQESGEPSVTPSVVVEVPIVIIPSPRIPAYIPDPISAGPSPIQQTGVIPAQQTRPDASPGVPTSTTPLFVVSVPGGGGGSVPVVQTVVVPQPPVPDTPPPPVCIEPKVVVLYKKNTTNEYVELVHTVESPEHIFSGTKVYAKVTAGQSECVGNAGPLVAGRALAGETVRLSLVGSAQTGFTFTQSATTDAQGFAEIMLEKNEAEVLGETDIDFGEAFTLRASVSFGTLDSASDIQAFRFEFPYILCAFAQQPEPVALSCDENESIPFVPGEFGIGVTLQIKEGANVLSVLPSVPVQVSVSDSSDVPSSVVGEESEGVQLSNESPLFNLDRKALTTLDPSDKAQGGDHAVVATFTYMGETRTTTFTYTKLHGVFLVRKCTPQDPVEGVEEIQYTCFWSQLAENGSYAFPTGEPLALWYPFGDSEITYNIGFQVTHTPDGIRNGLPVIFSDSSDSFTLTPTLASEAAASPVTFEDLGFSGDTNGLIYAQLNLDEATEIGEEYQTIVSVVIDGTRFEYVFTKVKEELFSNQ